MSMFHDARRFEEYRQGLTRRNSAPPVFPDSQRRAPVAVVIQKEETQHQKVLRLADEGKFDEAAKLAKGLIDSGNTDGFFSYGGTATHRRASVAHAENIDKSSRGAFSIIADVSPEMAQVILHKNTSNRKINIRGLSTRMRDIVDGKWELTGHGIVIAKTGELNDGQHRLWAAMLTGRNIKIPIFYGAQRASVRFIDSGIVRSNADRFHFSGVKNATSVSSIVSRIYAVEHGREPTVSERFDRYYAEEEVIQEAARLAGGLPKGTSIQNFGAAMYFILQAGARDVSALDFVLEVRGSALPKSKSSPTLKLREALLQKQFKAAANTQVFTIMDMYLRWRDGKKISGSSIPMVDEMPKIGKR